MTLNNYTHTGSLIPFWKSITHNHTASVDPTVHLHTRISPSSFSISNRSLPNQSLRNIARKKTYNQHSSYSKHHYNTEKGNQPLPTITINKWTIVYNSININNIEELQRNYIHTHNNNTHHPINIQKHKY